MTAPATRTATIDGQDFCNCDSCGGVFEVTRAESLGLVQVYCALCRALGVEVCNETAARVAARRK